MNLGSTLEWAHLEYILHIGSPNWMKAEVNRIKRIHVSILSLGTYQGCVKPCMKVFKYKHKPFTIMLITSPSTSNNFQKVFKYKTKPFVSVINSF